MTTYYPYRVQVALLILACSLFFLSPFPQIARSQDPVATQLIESNNPRVLQSGTWTHQSADAASSGDYLYSGGSENDLLALAFSGAALEVIYVAGPSLGTLAIEVDGTVLRTVITTAAQTAYAQSARIDYLDTGHIPSGSMLKRAALSP